MYISMYIDKLDISKAVTCVSAIRTYHKQETSRFQRNKKSFKSAISGSDSWAGVNENMWAIFFPFK